MLKKNNWFEIVVYFHLLNFLLLNREKFSLFCSVFQWCEGLICTLFCFKFYHKWKLQRLWLGHPVEQLVEALRYKLESLRFDSRWCHWYFSLTQSLWPYYGPGVNSASNRNKYQGYFLGGKGSRCVGLSTLPPSCADCLEIWEPQLPGTLRAGPGL